MPLAVWNTMRSGAAPGALEVGDVALRRIVRARVASPTAFPDEALGLGGDLIGIDLVAQEQQGIGPLARRLQDFVERSFEPGRFFANELDFQLQLDITHQDEDQVVQLSTGALLAHISTGLDSGSVSWNRGSRITAEGIRRDVGPQRGGGTT